MRSPQEITSAIEWAAAEARSGKEETKTENEKSLELFCFWFLLHRCKYFDVVHITLRCHRIASYRIETAKPKAISKERKKERENDGKRNGRCHFSFYNCSFDSLIKIHKCLIILLSLWNLNVIFSFSFSFLLCSDSLFSFAYTEF